MVSNPNPRVRRAYTTLPWPSDDVDADTPNHDAAEVRRARLCPSRHLTVDDLIRLFAHIEREGGIATVDETCQALPGVARLVSGLLDLCDARILQADFSAPFDGRTRFWRLDR